MVAINIGEISEELNNKADIDVQNLNIAGKEYITKIGMPSSTFVDLILGTNDATYTAPADGWFAIYGLNSVEDGTVLFYNIDTNFVSATPRNAFNGGGIGTNIPVRKNDRVGLYYDGISISDPSYYFRFYYAVGSEPNN